MTKYETIIGLEVHVALATRSKLFCACATTFGAAPNTQVCEICLGLPGALPRLNRQVVELAIRAGLATHCQIVQDTRFDRKNYFYPDLPKAYQISQLHAPICRDGWLEVAAGDGTEGKMKRIGIQEIHMEEDAGKLLYTAGEGQARVDYNRSGIPLLEIVSAPDFRTPAEATDYLTRLRAMLLFAGVTDGRMQEGSLRVDVNVSVRPRGAQALGQRTEMKNLNSFRAVARAIAAESRRQIAQLARGEKVKPETRRWDEQTGTSHAMRTKTDADAYRYFPEPDLPPVRIDDAWLARVAAALPELPAALRERYMTSYGLSGSDADLLTASPATVRLFTHVMERTCQAQEVANWLLGDFRQLHHEAGVGADEATIDPEALVAVIQMVADGRVTRDVARMALRAAYLTGVAPAVYVREQGLEKLQDAQALRAVVEKIMTAHPGAVADYRAGKDKALRFLIGQCMRTLRGRADAHALADMLREALSDRT